MTASTTLNASDLLDLLDRRLPDLPMEAAHAQEYAELGGYGSAYADYLERIARLIAKLKLAQAEIEMLRDHEHKWSREEDWCLICGADGRA